MRKHMNQAGTAPNPGICMSPLFRCMSESCMRVLKPATLMTSWLTTHHLLLLLRRQLGNEAAAPP